MRSYFTTALLLIFSFFNTASAATYHLDFNQGKVDLVPYVEYSVSPDNNLESPPIEGWSEFTEDKIKLGFNSNVHWFRVAVYNPDTISSSQYLELGYPLLDNINVYVLRQGRVQSAQQLGDEQLFKFRPVLHETFVVPITFLPMQEVEIYIAVESSGSLLLPVTLWQKEVFQEQQNYQRLLAGVYIGFISAAIFIYFIVFAFTKQLQPLLDAGLLFAIVMITMTISGLAFHYLWPNYPAMQQHAIYVFSCFAIFCSAFLAQYSLKRISDHNILISGFRLIALLSVVLLPLSFVLSYQVALYLITAISILICFAHIYAGIWTWRNGLHEEQEINLGISVLLFALLLISFNNFTKIDLPFTNLQLLQISSILLVTFITTSMIKKYLQNAPSKAQPDKSELNALLSAQRFELEITLRELQDRNSELEKLNTLDALSGINNRRQFDKRLLAELRRAKREQTQMALVLFDIDHFKKINDGFGHLAGDEVIRAVALTASEQLQRSSDEIFRYGGEEYALILPNTDISGATVIAEKVREAVEKLTITSQDNKLNCTISLGVCESDPIQAQKPEQLIDMADKALYIAKQSGRNQVIQYTNKEL